MDRMVRRFSTEQLARCDCWFNSDYTKDAWESLESLPGESEPFKVRRIRDKLLGVAKPGKRDNDTTRQARERIAFGLAHLLELPVPPIIFWDRGVDHADNRLVAISAWPFGESTMQWETAWQRGLISEASRLSVSAAMSAMIVFSAWINDKDGSTQHILVDSTSPDGELAIAFVDHAGGMQQGPNWGLDLLPGYDIPAPIDPEAMKCAASRIEGLPNSQIESLTSRIPEEYLPASTRKDIFDNLVRRKSCLELVCPGLT